MNKKKLASVVVAAVLSPVILASSAFAEYSNFFTNSDDTNASFDRGAAATYAVKHAKFDDRNTDYANFGSGNGQEGGDCTNFVSQALYSGGMKMKETKGSSSSANKSSSWFYYGSKIPNRTPSWTGADKFKEHWGVNMIEKSGGNERAYEMRVYTKAAAYEDYDGIYSYLSRGDIVQYVNGEGDSKHSQIVNTWEDGDIKVAQHSTNDGTWDSGLSLKKYLKSRKDEDGYIVLLKMKKEEG